MNIFEFLAANSTFLLIMTAIISLFIGSFLNVVIYRLPIMMQQDWSEECRIYLGLKPHTDIEKINLSLPFSHCPQCKKIIRPWHNIPVLSYLWLQAKCAYCSARISVRYPIVEILTCIISVYTVWQFGFSCQSLAGLLFSWIGICLTFIDLDYHLLPDQLTLLLLWLGLFFSVFSLFCDSESAILGAIIGYFIFAATQLLFGWFTGKTGMGRGDFKFLAALGGYLGWEALPFIILLASFTGIIFAIINMITKQHFKSEPLPFGPYLALAGWIALIWGKDLMHYYWQNF